MSVVWPLFKVPVPRTADPSRNVIVPVAVAGAVAVKVTGWLTIEGLSEDVTATVGAVLLTIWVRGTEVAALLFVSPP